MEINHDVEKSCNSRSKSVEILLCLYLWCLKIRVAIRTTRIAFLLQTMKVISLLHMLNHNTWNGRINARQNLIRDGREFLCNEICCDHIARVFSNKNDFLVLLNVWNIGNIDHHHVHAHTSHNFTSIPSNQYLSA